VCRCGGGILSRAGRSGERVASLLNVGSEC